MFIILSLILPKNAPIPPGAPSGLTPSSLPFLTSKNALSTSNPIEIPVPIPGNKVAIPDATSIKPPNISPLLNLLIANPHDIREPIPGILFKTGFKNLKKSLLIVPNKALAPPLPAILANGANKNLPIFFKNPFADSTTFLNKFLGKILANCLPKFLRN